MTERACNRPSGDRTGVEIYPAGLIVAGRRVLVVGGGATAARKVAGLAAAGADVHVIAPTVTDDIARTAAVVRHRPFRAGDCVGYHLVFAAAGDPAIDTAVAADAHAAGAWVNAADRPDLCSVQLPAVLRRGPITVAVSTAGTSPSLAGWLRDRIAEVVTERHAEVARVLAAERAAIHAAGGTTEGIDWRQRIVELVGEVDVQPDDPSAVDPLLSPSPVPSAVAPALAAEHAHEGAPIR